MPDRSSSQAADDTFARVTAGGRPGRHGHVGLLVALTSAVMFAVHVAEAFTALTAALATWLVARDWQHPRQRHGRRDAAPQSSGEHRLTDIPPSADRIPIIAAAATAICGAINIASAATPSLPGRLRELGAILPTAEIQVAHALALPVGVGLVAAAWPLARRRARALKLAVSFLGALAGLNLIKGLDVTEAAISGGLAVGLWRARDAFWVQHTPGSLRQALLRAIIVVPASLLLGSVAVAAAAVHANTPLDRAAVPAAAAHLLTLTGGPRFTAPFTWLPSALAAIGVATLLASARIALGPLANTSWPDRRDRRRAAAVVRRHGTDTLSAFKLRSDLCRHWSASRDAFAAYRIEARTMLLAGDPVAGRDDLPALLGELRARARAHGLQLAAVGASDSFADVARRAGMRSIYLGDEAILATGQMDLSGGSRKSLRKAVARVARNGYHAQLRRVDELDHGTCRQMVAVSERWLNGAAERGFSMAHDTLVDDLLPDALVVLGRDPAGQVRGFLHFVPVFGTSAVSLGFMRRDRDTPNGLSDFLVVEAARLLAERGIDEFSLNFASFGRWLREPAGIAERAAGKVMRIADRWFQIERLLRFNAKFTPRWQARHLIFERHSALPRVALAALWAEGQLPRPSLQAARRAREPIRPVTTPP